MQNQIPKLNPYSNYAAVIIDFFLFISLKWLALVCFWNEQCEPADWNYSLKKLDLAIL